MSERERPRPPTPADLPAQVERITLFVQECRTCQSEAAPHWQFCANCGTRLSTACPGCGSALPPLGARYCPHCGLDLPEDLWPSKAE